MWIRKKGKKVKSLSRVRLFVTPWTVAYQVPPSMGFFQARILEWVEKVPNTFPSKVLHTILSTKQWNSSTIYLKQFSNKPRIFA